MPFLFQPTLENEYVHIKPLQPSDFEALYAVASDPLIWEQHPNKNRYQRAVFETFFQGAIESGGAFLVLDKQSGAVIGSSRFYDYNEAESTVLIGYTFLAKDHWGTTYNRALKTLMLNHAFQYVDRVHFHVGAVNVRSQKAMERLGGKKIDSIQVAYFGEPVRDNVVFEIRKENW